jgi:heat shock protein HslJ
MKRLIQLVSLAVICLSFSTNLHAQAVNFKLVYNGTLARYEVYMNASTAYSGPLARISSSQVTIVVPHGVGASQFVVGTITGGNGNGGSPASMTWSSSRYDAPTENPTKDYLFFGYNASANPSVLFNIPANTDILLFHFPNTNTCSAGTVALIDNTNDPFLPPNSQSLNTPNAMTIFGAGLINNYSSNFYGPAACTATAALTAAYGSNNILVGSTTPLTLTLTNPTAGQSVSGLGYTYTLPAGLNVATPNALSNTCGGTVTVSGNTITVSGATMSSTTANCRVILNTTPPAVGTATASTANATGLSPNATNSSVTTPLSFVAGCAANAGILGY